MWDVTGIDGFGFNYSGSRGQFLIPIIPFPGCNFMVKLAQFVELLNHFDYIGAIGVVERWVWGRYNNGKKSKGGRGMSQSVYELMALAAN